MHPMLYNQTVPCAAAVSKGQSSKLSEAEQQDKLTTPVAILRGSCTDKYRVWCHIATDAVMAFYDTYAIDTYCY